MKKSIVFVIFLFSISFIISCSKDNIKEMTFVTYGGTGDEYMQYTNSIVEAYKEVNPNVKLKLEVLPSTEYDKIMQIRANSQKLPDIFVTRVVTMRQYVQYLLELNDLEASKNNEYANYYAIDGNIYGIPMRAFHEYIYYNKDIFKELNLEVPTTWQELIDVINKINADGKYIPLAIGAKDSWAMYPYTSFMPYLFPNGENVYSKMAETDTPFSKGGQLYSAYEKTQELLSINAAGKDPFGYGFSQAADMLYGKQAAMLAAGQWHLINVKENMPPDKVDTIGIFYMPVRETKNEPFRYIVSAEAFIGISKNSPLKEDAKNFIEWFFSSDYYTDFVQSESIIPTVKGANLNIDNIFTRATKSIDKPQIVMQLPGDDKFEKIKNYTHFDVKDIGQAVASKTNLDKFTSEWNKKWTEGKKSVMNQ